MGKSSRVRGRASVAAARRSRGSLGWYAAASAIVVLGVVLVAMSSSSSEDTPPVVGDHWHAAIGVNVCGTWQPDAPEFHERTGTVLQAGIHSHGDGLIHLHPYSSDEAGTRATLGRFFEFGGWDLSTSSISLWTGQRYDDGFLCDDEPTALRWSVNGEERTGDPSGYRPEQGDVIAIAILPEGDEIGEPPSAARLASPSDLAPGVTVEPPADDPSDAGTTVPDAGTTLPDAGTTAPSATTIP